MKHHLRALALATLMVIPAAAATAQEEQPADAGPVPLIDRDILFGNPERAAVRLSPDGKFLSYAAPLDGVMNLWVAPVDDLGAAEAVTHDTGRGITTYFWAYTNQHLIYQQDDGGNENFNLYVVDLESGKTRVLDKDDAVRAQIAGVSSKTPTTILVGLNRRSPMFHDLYTIDLITGEQTLLFKHPGMIDERIVAGLSVDDDYRTRFATAFNDDGGTTIFENLDFDAVDEAANEDSDAEEGEEEPQGNWELFETVAFEDSLSSGVAGFTADGSTFYMIDSKDRDTAALYAVDVESGERTLVAKDEQADVGDVMIHPTEHVVQAVAFSYEKGNWKVVDERIAADIEALNGLAGEGEWGVTSRTDADDKWIVYVSRSDGPMMYYLYTRDAAGDEAGTALALFSSNPKLEGLPLQTMHPVVIEARDGLPLVSYLTLPAGVEINQETGLPTPESAVPMVLYVHGGPWARDDFGYNPIHQWLANRGYAVLSVNFRGSTGFGKTHVNAGNKQWGMAMQDDLTDAVKWAVDNGIAAEDKVAIMGGSYGGYATLAGLTLTPDLYAAGVDIVGPSNIKTLLDTIPPYWAPAVKLFHSRVGDPNDEADSKMLDAVSPLNHVEKIKVPLLIGQGANDPRVKQSESDQIVEAMQAKGIPVTYVLYPDEGHGFVRPQNRMSFFGVSEGFLAEYLGGRYQPLSEADMDGSSIQVPAGAGEVPGLEQALPAK